MAIGTARYGYTGFKTDWKNRQMHKKCWKEQKQCTEKTGMHPMDKSAAEFCYKMKL